MGPNIYVFEDDESLRALLVELLHEEFDAQVRVCRDLAELQAQSAASPPELIVADFWGASHLHLADAERSEISSLAAMAPLVLVSARNWALDAQAAELGVMALLPKPLDIEGFLEVLRTALSSASPAGEWSERLPPHDAMSVFVLGWP